MLYNHNYSFYVDRSVKLRTMKESHNGFTFTVQCERSVAEQKSSRVRVQ